MHIICALQFGLEKFFMAYPDTKPTMEQRLGGKRVDKRKRNKGTDFQRNRHRGQGDGKFHRGADTRTNRKRKNCLSDNCPRQGRRGWAKGFCKSCAHKKGYKNPQSATKVSHQKKQKNMMMNNEKKCKESAPLALSFAQQAEREPEAKKHNTKNEDDQEERGEKDRRNGVKKKKKEVKVKKESKAACGADTEPVVKQCKFCRLVRFSVLNAKQHGLTDLANDDDETPISGQEKKNDTTKKQQEPSQMPKPPSPTEMFRVVAWPQCIFENKDEYGIEELEEEKGLGWHELSRDIRYFYEEISARQVFALMRFMATGQGGTLQEFELLSLEQKNSYDSDGDLGNCGIAPTIPYVALLTCLDPGWMPWRRHSLDKMKAGVCLPDSQKATCSEDTDDDVQELEDTEAEVIN